MAFYRFTVTLQGASLLPEDQYVNSFHFDHVEPVVITDYDNVRDMLRDFYAAVPAGGTNSICSFLSNRIQTVATVRAYDLGDAKPRAPRYESTFNLAARGSGDPMPEEVALVLSFERPRISGTPQSRRRNRIYLGPFAESANDTNARPIPALTTTMGRAARDLLDASNTSVRWTWEVNSPTYDEHGPVVGGWIDNAWDTQRRRGQASSTRTLWNDEIPA